MVHPGGSSSGPLWPFTAFAFLAAISLRFRLLSLQRLALTFGVCVTVFGHSGPSLWLEMTTMAEASLLGRRENAHTPAAAPARATRSSGVKIQRISRDPRDIRGRSPACDSGRRIWREAEGTEILGPAPLKLYRNHAGKGTPAKFRQRATQSWPWGPSPITGNMPIRKRAAPSGISRISSSGSVRSDRAGLQAARPSGCGPFASWGSFAPWPSGPAARRRA